MSLKLAVIFSLCWIGYGGVSLSNAGNLNPEDNVDYRNHDGYRHRRQPHQQAAQSRQDSGDSLSWHSRNTQGEGYGDRGYVSRDVVDRLRNEYRRIDTSTGQSWDPRERGFEGYDDYEDPQESYSNHGEDASTQSRHRRDDDDSWDRGILTKYDRGYESYDEHDDDRLWGYGDYGEDRTSHSRHRRDGARAWHAPSIPEKVEEEELKYEADGDSDDDEPEVPRQGRMRGSYSPVSSYDSRECGRSLKEEEHTLRAKFRILNGTCARYGDFPWVAEIQLRTPLSRHGGGGFKQHCGGTIVSEDLIVTAAHCVHNKRPNLLRIVVGQYYLDKTDDEERVFDVEDIEEHPKWDRDGIYNNDIAVIRIRRKGDGSGITFSEKVSPACLPRRAFEEGKECFIAGWGKTQVHGQKSNCLRSAKVPLISKNECRRMYADSTRAIDKGMLCAGYEDGGTDSCGGDSGGPLTCRSPVDGRFHLVGVVSWGKGCGAKDRPGVYSDVRHFATWISRVAEKTGAARPQLRD